MPWMIIIHHVSIQVAALGSRAPPSLAAVWRRTRDLSVRVAGPRSPEPERMTLFGSTLRGRMALSTSRRPTAHYC
jgi:hypothetical protein